MSKLTDLMDMYLAMRETGATRNDTYTVLDMINEAKKLPVTERKNSDNSGQELKNELEDRLLVKHCEFNNIKNENVQLLIKIKAILIDIENLKKEMDKMHEHWDDPKVKLAKLDERMGSILRQSTQLKSADEIDKEIRRFNETSVKLRSFRIKSKPVFGAREIKYEDEIQL